MKLRALKGQRAKVRNALQEELKKVDELSLQEAAAGDGLEFLVTTNLLKNVSEKLENLNSEILQHPDVSDEELEGEIQFTTDLDSPVCFDQHAKSIEKRPIPQQVHPVPEKVWNLSRPKRLNPP